MERVFLVKAPGGGMCEPPSPVTGIFERRLSKFRSSLTRFCPFLPPLTREQFVATYEGRGRKHRIYTRALETLYRRGVRRSDAYPNVFVKAEKLDLFEKPDPSPRIISPRKPEYNIEVGKYIKQIEHVVYRAIDSVFAKSGMGRAVVAKGRNAVERGAILREAWDSMADPVCLFLDASRFDQHVSEEALRFEHSVYEALYPGSKELKRLLSWQRENRAYIRTAWGNAKYFVRGGRMSGDMNTALGNVLLMCTLMHEFMRTALRGEARLVNDGDDCVLLVERKHRSRADCAISWFRDYGFTMKLEGETDIFERIEFCQSQPVFDGDRWVMVRDPSVCLDKDVVSVRPVLHEPHWRRLKGQIANCGLALAGNLPVLGAFYDALSETGIERKEELETGMDYLAQRMDGKYVEPTTAARVSYYLAFDVTPDEQEALEAEVRLWHGNALWAAPEAIQGHRNTTQALYKH
jgi:hypothetical protein